MRLLLLAPPFPDAEHEAAVHWAARSGFGGRVLPLAALTADELRGADVVWVHSGTLLPPSCAAPAAALAPWIRSGGRLLLSLMATPLAPLAGAPDDSPVVRTFAPWRGSDDPLWPPAFRDWPDYPHLRGMQGWGDHPLFDGLGRGAFTWRATEGEGSGGTCFRRPGWPRGRIVAVDRAYVQLDATTAVAWEYDVGSGRVLCLGSNVVLTMASAALVPQRDRFLANALASLDPARDIAPQRRASWPGSHGGASPAAGRTALALVPVAIPAADHDALDDFPLRLVAAAPDASALSLAGRRALLTGTEQRGMHELWCHPLCLVSGATSSATHASEVVVTAGAVRRRLPDDRSGEWRELLVVSPHRPVAALQLSAVEPSARPLELTLPLHLRLQWPYPADALLPLGTALRRDGDRWSVLVTSADPNMIAAVLVDGASDVRVADEGGVPRLHVTVSPSAAGTRLAIVGSAGGIAPLAADVCTLAGDGMRGLIRARREQGERLGDAAAIESGDRELDEAWRWAVARLQSFMAEVPGLGVGLLAGYAGTRPGWGESRPGYGWFFGRDACWTADALLATGRFDEVRCALEFLAATMDVTGKVAHEVTTSGAVHHDAADATPLWLRLVAAYAEWTGDLGTVRALWDAVRAAFDHVLAADRDGDFLPENTGEGHGWIESAPLGGGALTSYVASIWIDALRRLAPLARRLGDDALSERMEAVCTAARASFGRRLRDPESGRVVLQLGADGTPTPVLTALSAVPILLGVDDGAAADDALDALQSPSFSAPWGVRLVARDWPGYDPRGYHAGAVWPLFTGWVAWAHFTRWRADDGLAQLRAVAQCAVSRSKGAFDEVLDGDTGEGAGICPDQAWSAAMVIAPLVQGMLGVRPSAADAHCDFTPRWPTTWRRAVVRHLRVGRSVFSIEMQRVAGPIANSEPVHRHTFTLERGDPLVVALHDWWGATREGTLASGTPLVLEQPAPLAMAARHHGQR